MKRILLCLGAGALLVACNCAGLTCQEEPNLQNEIAMSQGACADVAYAETSAKLNESMELRAAGDTAAADQALAEAKELYNSAQINHADLQNSMDRNSALLSSQQSRLAKVQDSRNAEVLAYHKEAEAKIAACDVLGAELALNSAERALRALEGNLAPVVTPVSYEGRTYKVQNGDCLWKIAAAEYANPYFWPLIYGSNRDIIEDPDLIYPEQLLKIEEGTAAQKADATEMAKTRGAWSLFDNK